MSKRIKKKIRIKIRITPKVKYIKDRAIVNFILQHSKKETIDFSKIKIPSFLDISNAEEDGHNYNQIQNLNQESQATTIQNSSNLPTFGFSLLAEFSSNQSEKEPIEFKSSIFKRD